MASMFDDLKAGLSEIDKFLSGERKGYRVTLPTEVDVRTIRKNLHMTQTKFSDAFGFSIDAVKHWECGRRTPEASARAFLTVIAKNPDAVMAALHTPGKGRKAARSGRSAQRSRKGSKPSSSASLRA
jgi:putative transcriptional regulator